MKSLNELPTNKVGIIQKILPFDHAIKLLSIGFIPNKVIKVERKYFFGNTLYVLIDGYPIALTKEESKHILINEKD